mmetsp:Transcript_23937/g.66908  ORF Transcript_23937/g.66908 Transcript_23937/m.66908 type:complete len:248 (+) Transcript_23937:181-924(+)
MWSMLTKYRWNRRQPIRIMFRSTKITLPWQKRTSRTMISLKKTLTSTMSLTSTMTPTRWNRTSFRNKTSPPHWMNLTFPRTGGRSCTRPFTAIPSRRDWKTMELSPPSFCHRKTSFWPWNLQRTSICARPMTTKKRRCISRCDRTIMPCWSTWSILARCPVWMQPTRTVTRRCATRKLGIWRTSSNSCRRQMLRQIWSMRRRNTRSTKTRRLKQMRISSNPSWDKTVTCGDGAQQPTPSRVVLSSPT